jgi:hypothetical protein
MSHITIIVPSVEIDSLLDAGSVFLGSNLLR